LEERREKEEIEDKREIQKKETRLRKMPREIKITDSKR
jgi:hypothetical protein